jgi:hypothetical protein
MAGPAHGGSLIPSNSDALSVVSSQDGHGTASDGTLDIAERESADRDLTPFEKTIFFHPPILESFLAFLPTTSVIDLYHTSTYLRGFLSQYPLAWKTLSFRGPQPPLLGVGTPPVAQDNLDSAEQQRKTRALDTLLIQVVVPYGSRLTSLDLCNTAVSGMALTTRVLELRKQTLKHLSVRNCKNVSVKYHIVPWLQMHNPKTSPYAVPLALKSLYTYRCRHHRRRPYLPSHLARRDSDSEPTHELIELCHILGIWTDTAWCPTPGGRCFRRKEYHAGRAAPGSAEVWVPFDRLWRSSNRIGSSSDASHPRDGRLWEEELGYNGEALGLSDGTSQGKDVPAHLRTSYKTFVENVKCDSCGDLIDERCEQCSINMHCMGCRKTLCASCAFNRPLPRKRRKTRDFMNQAFGADQVYSMIHPGLAQPAGTQSASASTEPAPRPPKFWWAPGARRSPNLMTELANEEESDSEEEGADVNGIPPLMHHVPPKLNMHWCCIEPCFSGGGGLAIIGSGNTGGQGADRIRTAPLPKEKRYEDRDFQARLRSPADIHRLKDHSLYEHILGEDVDIVPYLQQDNIELQARTCPRNLCQTCYRTFHWKVACRACRKPLCKEHDFRGLKLRKCGYRDLTVEREHLRTTPPTTQLQIPPYRSVAAGKAPMRDIPSPIPLQHSNSNLGSNGGGSNRNFSSTLQPPSTSTPDDLSSSTILPPASSASSTPGPSRPRAFSLSELRSRLSTPHASSSSPSQPFTPETVQILSLPGKPKHPVQWQGCGAYFCQKTRGVGDPRPICTAGMRECGDCGVLVCEVSLTTRMRDVSNH